MAGVTDRPFRQLCKQLGAGYAVSEMAASNPRLWASEKSSRRTDHEGEMEPKAVQIAGADPKDLADCARFNVERGAQIMHELRLRRRRVRPRGVGSCVVAQIRGGPYTLRFQHVQSAIHQDAKEPRCKRTPRLKRIQLSMRGNKSVLHEIFCIFAIVSAIT